MDFDALARVFGQPQPDPAPPPPKPSEAPTSSDSQTASAPDRQKAREDRAAIPEHAAGDSQGPPDALAACQLPDPKVSADPPRGAALWGFAVAEMRAAAGADWPEIADRPEALEAFARLRRTRAQRERGERPEHYTRPALCAICGPVWLWAGGPARLIACPWCLAAPNGVQIPRPPVRCGTCGHFERSVIDPVAGIGRCLIAAPASDRGPALWPEARRTCADWRPVKTLDNPGAVEPRGEDRPDLSRI